MLPDLSPVKTKVEFKKQSAKWLTDPHSTFEPGAEGDTGLVLIGARFPLIENPEI